MTTIPDPVLTIKVTVPFASTEKALEKAAKILPGIKADLAANGKEGVVKSVQVSR